MAEPARRLWSLDEFLAFDDGSDTRYELFDGQIFAMAPTSDVHGALVARLHGQGEPLQDALLLQYGVMLGVIALAFLAARGLPGRASLLAAAEP